MTPLLTQLAPESALVLTALAAIGLGFKRRPENTSNSAPTLWLALCGIVAAGILLWWTGGENAGTPEAMVSTNALSRLFQGIVLALGFVGIAIPPAPGEVRHPGEFHALLLFALCGLLLVAGTSDVLMLFVALEMASLSLYLLAGFSRTAKASEAALKYFLFGAVSAAFFLFGLSLVYGFAGSTSLTVIGDQAAAGKLPLFAAAGLVMVLVGVGFKLAAAPFHFWAPDVYEGANATTVGMVSAATKAAALCALFKILVVGFGGVMGSSDWGAFQVGWAPMVAALAVVSMGVGNFLALAQKSVRRLLAYSAVANTGYLLVGFAGGADGALAALYYVVVYALGTVGAIAVVAAVERDRGSDAMDSFVGLWKRTPGQALALLVCLASLAGIPPVAGFFGKFAVFTAALLGSSGTAWLVAFAVAMSAMSLYYYLAVLKQVFVRTSTTDENLHAAPLPVSHRLAIALPAVALVLLGLFPSLLLQPIGEAVVQFLNGLS